MSRVDKSAGNIDEQIEAIFLSLFHAAVSFCVKSQFVGRSHRGSEIGIILYAFNCNVDAHCCQQVLAQTYMPLEHCTSKVDLTQPAGLESCQPALVSSFSRAKTLKSVAACFQVGDKLVQVSASFGDDVWEAGKFGQCMYAIKTRNGDLYFRFLKKYGDLSSFDVRPIPSLLYDKANSLPHLLTEADGQCSGIFSCSQSPQTPSYCGASSLVLSHDKPIPLQDVEETEAEAQFRKERAGGNYGGGTKELQLMNFKKRQEQDARRNGLFESGLDKFYKKDIQAASPTSFTDCQAISIGTTAELPCRRSSEVSYLRNKRISGPMTEGESVLYRPCMTLRK